MSTHTNKTHIFFSTQTADGTPVNSFSTTKWSAINKKFEDSPLGFYRLVKENEVSKFYKWIETDPNTGETIENEG